MDLKRARTEPTAKEHHECPCKQKNRITCITLKNTDGILSAQKTATAQINDVGLSSPQLITNILMGSYTTLPAGTVFTVEGIAGSYTLTAPLTSDSTFMEFSPSFISEPAFNALIDFNPPDGNVSRLVGEVNTEGSYYEFDVGTSFSVHRHKPCIIRVCSGSVGFLNNADAYTVESTARVDGVVTSSPIPIRNVNIPPGFVPIGTTFKFAGITGTTYATTQLVKPDSVELHFTPALGSSVPDDGALITFTASEVGVASIDLMTNIQVQGLAKNMPNSPAEQVVQCEMDVAATNQLNVASTNLSGVRIFHATQPYMTRFRCQSLPDKIQLQMARVPTTFKQFSNNFTRTAPDFISMALEIEFDE